MRFKSILWLLAGLLMLQGISGFAAKSMSKEELQDQFRKQYKNADEAKAAAEQFRKRFRAKKVDDALMKKTLEMAKKQKLSAGEAAAVAAQAQNQFRQMRRYGYAKRDARRSCLEGVSEGLNNYRKQNRARKGKGGAKGMKNRAESEVENALKQQFRKRMRNRKGQGGQNKNASGEMKRLRKRKRDGSCTDGSQKGK